MSVQVFVPDKGTVGDGEAIKASTVLANGSDVRFWEWGE